MVAHVMPRPKLNRPTDSELAILRALWKRGPSTVRQVFEDLGEKSGYTTILKFMQIMTEKGLLERDEVGRTHVYRPKQSAEKTRRGLIHDLLERGFGGSAKELVLHALSAKPASREELAEIRKLISEMEKKYE
jgi:predicted transcriptional regulator